MYQESQIKEILVECLTDFYDDILNLVISYVKGGYVYPTDTRRWMKPSSSIISKDGTRVTASVSYNGWDIVLGDPCGYSGSYGFRLHVHHPGKLMKLGVALIQPDLRLDGSPVSILRFILNTEACLKYKTNLSKTSSSSATSGSSIGMSSSSNSSIVSYEMVMYNCSQGKSYYPALFRPSSFVQKRKTSESQPSATTNTSSSSTPTSSISASFSSRRRSSATTPLPDIFEERSSLLSSSPSSIRSHINSNLLKCLTDDSLDFNVHLDSNVAENNWVSVALRGRRLFSQNVPNWSYGLKMGCVARPIIILANDSESVSIGPFQTAEFEEGEFEEELEDDEVTDHSVYRVVDEQPSSGRERRGTCLVS